MYRAPSPFGALRSSTSLMRMELCEKVTLNGPAAIHGIASSALNAATTRAGTVNFGALSGHFIAGRGELWLGKRQAHTRKYTRRLVGMACCSAPTRHGGRQWLVRQRFGERSRESRSEARHAERL